MFKDNISFIVKHISVGVDRYVNNELKEFGLTLTQMRVMGFIKHRGELDTSFSNIEEFLSVSHPTVIGIIKRLEQNGFVIVNTPTTDKRVRLVSLTDKHKDLFKSFDESQLRLEGKLVSNLTDKEIANVKNCLNVMLSNLHTLNS